MVIGIARYACIIDIHVAIVVISGMLLKLKDTEHNKYSFNSTRFLKTNGD